MLIPATSELAQVAAIGWDGWLVLAVITATVIGTAYGLKTRKGSGINEHPGPDSGDPVSSEESDPSAAIDDEHEDLGSEEDKDSSLEQRGTK